MSLCVKNNQKMKYFGPKLRIDPRPNISVTTKSLCGVGPETFEFPDSLSKKKIHWKILFQITFVSVLFSWFHRGNPNFRSKKIARCLSLVYKIFYQAYSTIRHLRNFSPTYGFLWLNLGPTYSPLNVFIFHRVFFEKFQN
jgi:hypothetical protein